MPTSAGPILPGLLKRIGVMTAVVTRHLEARRTAASLASCNARMLRDIGLHRGGRDPDADEPRQERAR